MSSIIDAAPGPQDPAGARAVAREILSGRRYSEARVRRPFQRQLRWAGRQLDRFFRWLESVFDVAIPGSGALSWVVVGVLAVIAVMFLVKQFGGRRRAGATSSTAAVPVDVSTLERDADAAEACGDHRRAVELRFRAGIARLESAGALPATKRTNASIVQVLPGPFDGLGASFDAIHYGDAPASPADSERARRLWPDVHRGIERAQGTKGQRRGRTPTSGPSTSGPAS